MTVEIKDKDKVIVTGLQAVGYKLDSKEVERILNIIDFIRTQEQKGVEATLRDMIQISEGVNSLYED